MICLISTVWLSGEYTGVSGWLIRVKRGLATFHLYLFNRILLRGRTSSSIRAQRYFCGFPLPRETLA